MSFFRIYIYLKLKYFFFSIFKKDNNLKYKIQKKINIYTKKKFTVLTGQLRVGFFLVLDFLKKENPKKNEIIISSYNLPEMINICKNMKLKIIFPKLNDNIFISAEDLKKKINKKTLAVVITNIFNHYKDIEVIKKICRRNRILLIEDNAIYFGNFIQRGNKKLYSGSFGDYTLHSFNIMKNISGMYGGSVSTNDKIFYEYSKSNLKNFRNFSKIKYLRQCLIYFVLKILSINILYKYFFIKIIRWSHKTKNKLLLTMMYPSLNFTKGKFSSNFFSNLSSFSKKIIFLQLENVTSIVNGHKTRKKNNLHYEKSFKKIMNKNFKIIEIKDKNFQNFNEYPIITKNKKTKEKLVDYLLSKGIETKVIQYFDCEKIFAKKGIIKTTYQDRIICFPNHVKIKEKYIDYIISNIKSFFQKKLYEF